MTAEETGSAIEPLNANAPLSAIVLSGTGGVWKVRTENGEIHEASMRGRLKQTGDGVLKLAVGDNVTIARVSGDTLANGSFAWTITHIAPRRSRLARREPGGRYGERIIVANLDEVVVVFAVANPEPSMRMLDRFLVIAEANELHVRIVVNKIEITGEAAAHAQFVLYEKIGYPVHYTSAVSDIGIDELRTQLAGRISALSGPSGVGKSSLLNAMYPGLNLRVGAVSEAVGKGQHTTVGAVMNPLPDGGYVVDTPGLREVGMWQLPASSLDDCFPEFRPFLGLCRFADCSHLREPGCAIRTAIDEGSIARARYDSYCKLREELEAAASSLYR